MLNHLRCISKPAIITGIATACISTIWAAPASSQILPEVWGTIGTVDDLVSYGAGFRFAGTALEVGTGEEGATGADFLTFVPLPVVSPFLGIGYYTGDENIAYSGGVHISAGKFLVVGGGYHSVRGINGILGFKF
ncbi:hypothetical protein I4641_16605 [Waterburya agarophytonicola K14]|uniref:Uncharacterized protein n=1 Tax=Waterburya agarophytonicola KI4 TaxID=2874699 RepID=A0A964BVU3_9CYAN|nr:hypothetical protein [Waterburya agarophytonicola]MCC0178595.1 hypothetical protein [Waterburya agarophytonicola KI4]